MAKLTNTEISRNNKWLCELRGDDGNTWLARIQLRDIYDEISVK